MSFKRIFVLVFILFLSNTCLAENITGATILHSCKKVVNATEGVNPNPNESGDISLCVGYLTGLVNTHEAIMFMRVSYNKKYEDALRDYKKIALFCLGNDVTMEQVIRVTVNYLEKHPEDLNKNPTTPIFAALRGSFPCTK